MIRRESILATVMRIEAALPARLKVSVTVRGGSRPPKGKKKKGKKAARAKPKRSSAGARSGDSFSGSFSRGVFRRAGAGARLDRRGRAGILARPGAVRNAFSARAFARRRGARPASGPFVDRVALLLDPSLMEQARRAAGKFQAGNQRRGGPCAAKDLFAPPRQLMRGCVFCEL